VAERLNTAYTKNFRAGIDFAPDRLRTVDVLPAVLAGEIEHASNSSEGVVTPGQLPLRI